MPIKELDITSANLILDKYCFNVRTESAINKWINETENCYQSFQRRKLSIKHEDGYRFFCFSCIKALVFHIFYFDFFILDKEYKIKNVSVRYTFFFLLFFFKLCQDVLFEKVNSFDKVVSMMLFCFMFSFYIGQRFVLLFNERRRIFIEIESLFNYYNGKKILHEPKYCD